MNVIKNGIFIFLALWFSSIAPVVAFADVIQDCIKKCGDQKASDDSNCQGPGQGADQGRALCLKNNQEIYDDCLHNCSPNVPPATAPKDTEPKTVSPKPAGPQGTTPKSTVPQSSAPAQGTTP